MAKIFNVAVLVCALTGASLSGRAQMAVPPPAPAYQPLSDDQMDQLLGPIALYPDPLIAQVLPAATLPTQIVLADRYVTGGGDPNAIDQQPWDTSVQALARYPDVLKWMDDNLNWTTELGQAFLNQQQDVMDSIQRLRQSAQNFGNLQSTPQQQVVEDNGGIEILPADPQVIYVPVYQPDQVYYQSGFGLSFGIGFAIGGWLDCDVDWHNRHLIVWDRDHPRPADWWHERPAQRASFIGRQTNVWRPEDHRDNDVVDRGDRGWNNQPAVRPVEQHPVTTIGTHVNTPRPAATPRPASVPVERRPAPAPVQHYQPISRPTSNGAFIGIQSSRDTKTYSNRGQQSRQTVTHPAPVSRPAPSSHSGGGSAGHGSGSQPKH
ncbi:MAG TPA: DUF3300 domain-containing protein [Candidatus Acidoferrales bacterium]|nr:DUF3300 domain-containing protein [Candidatus Acidoferrales bacterium]